MKTNISTDELQSQRLLRCGVSADTADMCWYIESGRINIEKLRLDTELIGCSYDDPKRHYEFIPAWSLSALLVLLPPSITDETDTYFQLRLTAFPHEEDCYKWDISYYSLEGEISLFYNEAPDPIEACVRMVEILVENGYKLNEQ